MKAGIMTLLAAASVCASVLAGCGGGSVSLKDGIWEGKSSVYENNDGTDDGNGYGVAVVTVKDGRIVDCTFMTYELDGSEKDENYGMEDGRIANRDYYNKAQKANAARDEYAADLTANGSLDGIDAISGATINYNQFREAVEAALEMAAG